MSCVSLFFCKAKNEKRRLCTRLAYGALVIGSLFFLLCRLNALPTMLVHDIKFLGMSLFGFSLGVFVCLDLNKD